MNTDQDLWFTDKHRFLMNTDIRQGWSVSRTIAVALFAALSAWPTSALAEDTTAAARTLRLVADAVVKGGPFGFVDTENGQKYASPINAPEGAHLRLESPYADWRYWNGVLNLAMLRLGDVLHHPEYAEFARKNIAFAFNNWEYFKEKYHGEGKWNCPFGQYFMMEELDDCGAMGAAVVEVQRRMPEKRYQTYIDKAANHILRNQARLDDGTLVRSFPQKWTLWADDLYMSVVLLARMGETTGDRRYFDDAARQVINFHHHLFDGTRGLMHHCWYSDVGHPGVAFWGRANGWAMLAQVDLLDRLPTDHPKRAELMALLGRHILGVAQYQSGEGLWHQLIDKTDSYLETSCTAMFSYGIARAVNKGYIEPRYGTIARRGWEGVLTRIRPDGQVEGVCAGTGVGDDLVHYYKRPTPLNDPHGIGAVLLAGIEVLQVRE
jgi:unsaturated rhamnogalacturonyl hydrolase